MTLHNTKQKRTLHKTEQEKDFTLKYKRYSKGKYMSPPGRRRINKETNDKPIHKVYVRC